MKKTDRIHVLVAPDDKASFVRAAEIERLTLSAWVVRTLVREAAEVQANQRPLGAKGK